MSRKNRTCAWFSSVPVVLWASVLAGAGLPLRAEAGPPAVDLELVLAVDVSGSMSRAELLVQRQGYIDALRSPDLAAAIAMRGDVALSYVEWAGPDEQRIVVPWTVLSGAADAAHFADTLAAASLDPGFRSRPSDTGTSVSRALQFAAGMFSAGGGTLRTIDISGDGPNNTGPAVAPIRDAIVGAGATINGLALAIRRNGSPRTTEQFGAGYVASYYEDCVIGGPGAFVILVEDSAEFEAAIRRKLVLEIAGPPVRLMHAAHRSTARPAVECAAIEASPGQ